MSVATSFIFKSNSFCIGGLKFIARSISKRGEYFSGVFFMNEGSVMPKALRLADI